MPKARTKHPNPLFDSFNFLNDNCECITDKENNSGLQHCNKINFNYCGIDTTISKKISKRLIEELKLVSNVSITDFHYQTDKTARHLGDIVLYISMRVL